MPRLSLAVLTALAISGCMQRQDAGRDASSGDGTQTTATSDSIPIRRLDDANAAVYRYNSGIPDSSFTTIRDADRWEDMWRRLTARHGPPRPPPPIDFNREMALVATLGTQRTGGYTITIDAAIDRGTVVEAHVSRRAPGRECGVTAALTAPADVAIVPRREVEVRMLAHDYIADCSTR